MVTQLRPLLEQVNLLLPFMMVVIALAISAATTVRQMISLYRLQAVTLTIIVLLTALVRSTAVIALLAVVPAFLAYSIRPILGRASLAGSGGTASGPLSTSEWVRSILGTILSDSDEGANQIWLRHGRSRLNLVLSTSTDLLLIVLAFAVAYLLVGASESGTGAASPTISVGQSMALLLQGLFTMINKRDIIAQIIGLLVMEHGLFLAAVSTSTTPALATSFVVGLLFYLLVTLAILFYILPKLHELSGSIEIDDQEELRG